MRLQILTVKKKKNTKSIRNEHLKTVFTVKLKALTM